MSKYSPNFINKLKEINKLYGKIKDIKEKHIIKNIINKNRYKNKVFCRIAQKRNNTFVNISHTNNNKLTENFLTPNILSIKNVKKNIKGKKSNNFLRQKLFRHLARFIKLNRNNSYYFILSNTDKFFNSLFKQRSKNIYNKMFQKIKWNIKKTYN